ncbi:MAG TPA: ATP-dependent zinc metalloprotease FtsH [Candidatus Egerieisoma faecipullorum]|uniref:ATP-dependent zinc metalloprotease FtsH n=1 Tax=Candidatus Egerieisoma faecipullorum TaxID=2840963 RepID=A0A9D1I9W5_9CLOT|nr:ATP-dependent zinc metalloprotease FtsH [Candidatus Egerieisoma faecipullorum]
MKLLKSISPYLVIVGIIVLFGLVITSLINPPEITYTEFMRELNADNIEKVDLEDNTATVVLKETSSSDQEMKAGKYMLNIKSYENFDQMMLSELQNGSTIEYKAVVKKIPFIVSILPYILLVVLFFIFMYVMLGQGQGGGGKVMNFGKSRARLYTTSKITFADVAGAEEEKEEMMELVSFLKNPKRYSMLGARIPKGVLMVGPPGTGKTYLAKAVAGEAGVPFFSISGSDFVEMYVGVGASRVRDLFEQAKKNSPCIVFIDEIDAVGRHRGAGLGGGHDEREQTLNQLLVEMDGFGMNEGVIVIAATNRPDILDPALTRPGRFDRKIVVGYPDIKAREEILKVHAKNKPLQENVNLSDVAKITSGFTAADLENLLNEAALLAARDRQEAIGPQQIKEATFRVIVGPEKKSRVMTEKDKWLTALHEVGHAIAVKLLSSTEKVDRISIIPAGGAGGYTAHRPEEDTSYMTRSQLNEEIMICLGGKAAEDLVLNEVSTGASSDLKRANTVAHNMVAKYGMSESIGNLVFDNDSNEVFIGKDYGHTRTYSEETAAQIDREVKTIIDHAYAQVKAVLTDNIDKLNRIARALLEKERIEGEEFEALMNE